jgi:hypothetical protein
MTRKNVLPGREVTLNLIKAFGQAFEMTSGTEEDEG